MLCVSVIAESASYKKGLSENEISALDDAREQALADAEKVAVMSRTLADYISQTSRYENRMPNDIAKVETIIEDYSTFIDDELEPIKEELNALYEAYAVSGAKDLERAIGKQLNPAEWMGMPIATPFSGYQLDKAITSIESLGNVFNQGLAKAEKNKSEDAIRNQEKVSIFPENNFTGDGDLASLQNQATKSLVSNKVAESDMTNVAITSGWTDGVFPVTKIPFRTIRGSVLFKDTDEDGLCRFNGYTFISVDGADLEYKAVRGGGDGYADCDDGKNANGGLASSSGGFFSSLIWLLLVVINLLAGGLILKEKFSSIKVVKQSLEKLQPFATTIGLAAIGLGILSFLMAFLSLSLLSNIIPQVSAVLVGAILSAQFIAAKKKHAADQISKIQPFTHSLGLTAMGVGLAHLILSGSLYFI